MQIDWNFDDWKELERQLGSFVERAIPFATRNTLNAGAFAMQKDIKRELKRDFTLRNQHTVRSIQVEKARTLNMGNMEAVVGSTAGYMEDQEFGTTKSKQGKKGVAIPTGYSAGQKGAQPRTGLPTEPNTLKNIQLNKKGRKGSSRKQKNVVAIKQAARSGKRFVYLDLGTSEGIFKVIGGPRYNRIRMVHDLSRQSVEIPAKPWLKPAEVRILTKMPAIHLKSLKFQMERLGLFND